MQLSGLHYCLFIAVILLVPVILSLCASSLALLLLAANQYLAICNPLFAQTRVSPGRAGLFILAAWLTSAAAAALPALLILTLHYSDDSRDCTHYVNPMANKSLEVGPYITPGHCFFVSYVFFLSFIFSFCVHCSVVCYLLGE